jgi:hypothetical protein
MKTFEFRDSRERSLRMLARPYFRDVCSSVLNPYLEAHGFRRTRFGLDQLSYRRGQCVLEFGYVPYVTDERPRYAVTVAIGAYRGRLRKLRRIGLWQVPSPDRGGKHWQWEFRGSEQLERSLKRLVRLLDGYAKPLWEDEKHLQAVLDREWPIYLEMANP